MDRDEEFRLGQGQNHLQLLLTGMAGNVQVAEPVVNYLGPLTEKLVYDPAYRGFIAGNRRGGDNHPVPCVNFHLAVSGKSHTIKSGHVFALAAGSNNHNFFSGIVFELVHIHQNAFGHFQVSQLRGNFNDVFHAAPGNTHLAPIFRGHIDYLLYSMNV